MLTYQWSLDIKTHVTTRYLHTHAWKIQLWLGSNNIVATIVTINVRVLQISQKVEYGEFQLFKDEIIMYTNNLKGMN